MNHRKLARELGETFVNGNRSDLVAGLKALQPLDCAMVVLELCRIYPKEQDSIRRAIEARN